MISDTELAQIQATLAETRTDTANILTYVEVIDPTTGVTAPQYVLTLSVPCRVVPQGMQAWTQTSAFGQSVTTSVWWICLPPGTTVNAPDRIQVGERVHNVVASQSPRTLELETRVQCLFIQ